MFVTSPGCVEAVNIYCNYLTLVIKLLVEKCQLMHLWSHSYYWPVVATKRKSAKTSLVLEVAGCFLILKNYSVLKKTNDDISIVPLVWKKYDKYMYIMFYLVYNVLFVPTKVSNTQSRKSNSKHRMLTKLTFTVSQHQHLKINWVRNWFTDMFYMADRAPYSL